MTEQIELLVTNISARDIVLLKRILVPGDSEYFLESDLVQSTHAYELEEQGKLEIRKVNKGIVAHTYAELMSDSRDYPVKETFWLDESKSSLVREVLYSKDNAGNLVSIITKDYNGNGGTPTTAKLLRTTIHNYDESSPGITTRKKTLI